MSIEIDPYEKRKKQSIYWFNKSSDLRGSAAALWACQDKTRSGAIASELNLGAGFSLSVATWPVYRMLCGMALELAYKAIAVAKGEEIPATHNLPSLARLAGVSIENHEQGLLEILTEAVIWAGRYPIPMPKRRSQVRRLNELVDANLRDRVPLGRLHVLQSNGALDWPGFDKLWSKASDVYWAHHKD